MTVEEALLIAWEHHQAGRFTEAIAAYGQVLALEPNQPDALHRLGLLARRRNREDLAIQLIRQAIASAPNVADYHCDLGVALMADGQVAHAIETLRHAVALNPEHLQAHYNLGNALKVTGQLDEAIMAYQRAIVIDSACFQAHNNLAIALRLQGRCDQAVNAYRQALALQPDNPEIHWNLAIALLLEGRLEEGWPELEWRWRCQDRPPRQDFSVPQWRGEDPAGRSILLHSDEGFGDAIQFSRYAPLLAARGARVIVECQRELTRLLAGLAGVAQVVADGEPLPPFDLHCPMLSLPLAFGTTLESIPANVPYLWGPPSSAPAMQSLWPGSDGCQPSNSAADVASRQFKVGLVWAGRPTHQDDRNRSLPLTVLSPLFEIPAVRFFSLQKGPAAALAHAAGGGMSIVDLAGGLRDFADTASAVAQLDLVISVDTAVAHLAGAMAKPVWLLLPFAPDWRWLLNRTDSPWYPTMRLFRQTRRGDWANPIQEISQELRRLLVIEGQPV